MKLSKTEKEMLRFLMKYPDQWHSYANDAKTIRSVAGLYFYRGLGVRGLEVSRYTHQMRLNGTEFKAGLPEGFVL